MTWVMQRRMVMAERLRKELAEIDAEVARLEAVEVVIGQFIEAERAGEADDPAMGAELEQVTSMLLVPQREPDRDADLLPEDYQAIRQVVARAASRSRLVRSASPWAREPCRARRRRCARS